MVEVGLATTIAITLGGAVFQELSSRGIDLAKVAKNKKDAQKRIQVTLEKALRAFASEHPAISASLFDSEFLMKAEPEILRLFQTRNERPRATELKRLYLDQFSSEVPADEIEEACECFIQKLEEAVESEPIFQQLMDSREISETKKHVGSIQEEMQRGFQSITDSINMQAEEEPLPSAQIDNGLVLSKFGQRATDLLEWPQTLHSGEWIERPELEELDEFISTTELDQQDSNITVLLGSPGCGKSALLARLGSQLREGKTPLLALKADSLPDTIDSLKKLEEYLNLPETIEACLNALTDHGNAVVLIDQLDAISTLMVNNPGRLNALIDLVWTASHNRKVKIILSCRTFEYQYDARFAQLKAQEVHLKSLDWAEVEKVLKSHNISSANWPQEFRDILLTPQHLNIFLRYLSQQGGPQVYSSYRAMLQDIWEHHVVPSGGDAAACAIAGEMSDREELWVPVALFESTHAKEIVSLEQCGILVRQGREKIGFRHQTVFDFARAKSYIRREESLSAYTIERQNSLFIRPILWSALDYLRDLDIHTYTKELETIWSTDNLRTHLRFLLIEFIGRFDTPLAKEIQLLLPLFSDETCRPKILNALSGSKGWFDAIEAEVLPSIMDLDSDTAWLASSILAQGMKHSTARSLSLLKKHWAQRPEMQSGLCWLLINNYIPSEDVDNLLFSLIDLVNIGAWETELAIKAFLKDKPENAAFFLSKVLDKKFENAILEIKEKFVNTPDENTDEIAATIRRNLDNHRPLTSLISSSDWHDLENLVLKAPIELVPIIFSWFAKILDHVAYEGEPYSNCYIEDQCLDSYDREHPSSFMVALRKGVELFASDAPDTFVAFADSWKTNELMGIHRVLIRGYIVLSSISPTTSLNYLLEDPRRFSVGDMSNTSWHSTKLIKALIPQLTQTQAQALENQILSWNPRPYQTRETAEDRRLAMKWNHEDRLVLLNAFPKDQLTPTGIKTLREGRNAGLRLKEESFSTDFQWIGSCMSAEQMEKAKDDDIINLFSILNDSVNDHPRNWKHGGSREASNVFEVFSKNNHERALTIIDQFTPGQQDNPTGAGFKGVVESESLSPENACKLFIRLVDRGCSSDKFKHDCTTALRNMAHKHEGLPDDVCDIIKGWIYEWEPVPDSNRKSEKNGSILWGNGGITMLPGGNYTYLDALTLGLLCRKPPAANAWMNIIVQHLALKENPKVWLAFISRELRWLSLGEAEQASRVVALIYITYPKLLYTEDSVHFLAYAHRWLKCEYFQKYLNQFRDGQWPRGDQAFGELITLRAALYQEDGWTQQQLDDILSQECTSDQLEDLRTGCAWTASGLWENPGKFDTFAEDILTRLAVEPCSEEQAKAMLDMFRKTGPLRHSTSIESLLRAYLGNQTIMCRASNSFLADKLVGILTIAPGVVADIAEGIIVATPKDERSKGVHRDHLVQISLALHRMPEYQERGLTMFENLLTMQAYHAVQALEDLTRYPVK